MSANNARNLKREFGAGRPLEGTAPQAILQEVIAGRVKFQNLSNSQQLAAYAELSKGKEMPEATLLSASQTTTHDCTDIAGNPDIRMDRGVYRIQIGHIIMITQEVGASGMGPAMAGFVGKVLVGSLTDPAMTVAPMPNMIGSLDPTTLTEDELQTALLTYAQDGLAQDIGVDAKYTMLKTIGSRTYARTTIIGTVLETPCFVNDEGEDVVFNNDGIIEVKALGGQLVIVEQSNVRILHVIGLDVATFPPVQPSAQD